MLKNTLNKNVNVGKEISSLDLNIFPTAPENCFFILLPLDISLPITADPIGVLSIVHVAHVPTQQLSPKREGGPEHDRQSVMLVKLQ